MIIYSPLDGEVLTTKYVEFDDAFDANFTAYLNALREQAEHYELIADQLERNPVLAIDYLKRAFLITGDEGLRGKAQALLAQAGLEDRAKNSVEQLAAAF